MENKKRIRFSSLLLVSVFVVATCGLIYELIAGTLASYLLGDSVTQFSLIIGVYLFSMGVGSYLSKFITTNLLQKFVLIEILVGLIGGCSAAILFVCFNHIESFRILLFGLVAATGTLVGLEIPLLMAILRDEFDFRDLVSRVFSFDYIGALFASIIFPLLLVPKLGLIRTAFFFGILNTAVALWVCIEFGHLTKNLRLLKTTSWGVLFFLITGFAFSNSITKWTETQQYMHKIIYAQSSPYQRIILTKENNDLRLFLNGNLQFSSRDEYRYHEALVHPAMQSANNRKKILVLGGGDGLAVREILKYPDVEAVHLVDLDSAMTQLFKTNSALLELNENSLLHEKVSVSNTDAFIWLKENKDIFDVIIIDFPDPSNFSLGKLYSLAFYEELKKHLSDQGACVIQSTSPYYARKSFWCIENTCRAGGWATTPYHAYVPSFGEWGFILIHHSPRPLPFISKKENMRFLDTNTWQQMQNFPQDMSFVETEINRLNNQSLVHYFEEEWGQYE